MGKPYNSWLPSDTFTWSLWAKNTAGSYSNGAWQMLLNIRLLNDADTNHKLSLLSGGGNGDQVVMVYINKFSADGWMPCSPDDNAAGRYHTPAGGSTTVVRRALVLVSKARMRVTGSAKQNGTISPTNSRKWDPRTSR